MLNWFEERFDEDLRLLQTIPGISAEQAALILAELGDVRRFPTVDKVVAFAGLDPKVRESGKWKGKRKLSKKGSPTLRATLYRAAMGCRFKNPVVEAEYERRRSDGRSYRESLVSASRKLLKVVYAVLRDRKPFHLPENLPNP
ncbi:MAG: transposase [Candidatus Jordarchaeaceae archaeon]